MSVFNVTVDDSSPLISYTPAGAWVDSPAGDSLLSEYFDSSYHSTTAAGATATFEFNGTAVWVFGALRPNHGHFQAALDGGKPVTFDGFKATPVIRFGILTASGFPMGPHTVSLSNAPTVDDQPGFDIDFIVIETTLPETIVSNVTLDDTVSGLTYVPDAGAWTAATNQAGFFNQTAHATQTAGASVSFAFEGDAVGLYGSVSQNQASYTINVDGTQSFYNSSVSTIHDQTLLYFASNLGPGPHQVTMTNGATGQYLDLDFLQIYLTNSSSGLTTTSSDSTAIGISGINSGEIAGIVFSVILGLCLIASALICVVKRRKRSRLDGDSGGRLELAKPPLSEIPGLEKPSRTKRPPALTFNLRPQRPNRPQSLELSPPPAGKVQQVPMR